MNAFINYFFVNREVLGGKQGPCSFVSQLKESGLTVPSPGRLVKFLEQALPQVREALEAGSLVIHGLEDGEAPPEDEEIDSFMAQAFPGCLVCNEINPV